MKINLPIIATVAALTVIQAGYPLIRPSSAAHPLPALTQKPGHKMTSGMTGSTNSDQSPFTPEQQAIMQQVMEKSFQEAIKSGHTSGISATINGKPADPRKVQRLMNALDTSLPTGVNGLSGTSRSYQKQWSKIAKAIQDATNGGQPWNFTASISGAVTDPQQIQRLNSAFNVSGRR